MFFMKSKRRIHPVPRNWAIRLGGTFFDEGLKRDGPICILPYRVREILYPLPVLQCRKNDVRNQIKKE